MDIVITLDGTEIPEEPKSHVKVIPVETNLQVSDCDVFKITRLDDFIVASGDDGFITFFRNFKTLFKAQLPSKIRDLAVSENQVALTTNRQIWVYDRQTFKVTKSERHMAVITFANNNLIVAEKSIISSYTGKEKVELEFEVGILKARGYEIYAAGHSSIARIVDFEVLHTCNMEEVIKSIAVSRTLVACGTESGKLHLLKNMKTVSTLTAYCSVDTCAFNDSGNLLLFGGGEKLVTLYETDPLRYVARILSPAKDWITSSTLLNNTVIMGGFSSPKLHVYRLDFQTDIEHYIKTQKLKTILDDVCVALLRSRPKNPREFLANYFSE